MGVPLFPPVEANQGLFSLTALVIALGALVLQVNSARRAKERRIRDYLDLVLGLIDPLIGMGRAAVDEANAAPDGENIAAIGRWNALRAVTLEALEAIRLTPAPQAALAVEMVYLLRVLNTVPGALSFDQIATAIAYVHSRLDELRPRRAALAELRHF
jgi:hypothetical protein